MAALVFIGVSYMLHKAWIATQNAWDGAEAWAKRSPFRAGFIAGVAAAVAVRVLVWWLL